MLFQRITRTDPDKVFIIVHNNQGGNIVRGDILEFDDAAGATYPGVSVELADSAAATLVAGVCEGATIGGGTVATGDFGLCQVYGYHDAIITDGTVATAGEVLVSDANGDADVGAEGTQTLGIFAVALGADTGTLVSGIIRCM